MSDKTARHYREHRPLPSTRKRSPMPRTYRTRLDPFAAVWPAVEERLHAEPRLLAKTLFDWLRQAHPGQFGIPRRIRAHFLVESGPTRG